MGLRLQERKGYYLKHLTPEIMELLGRTKSKITKDRNGEDVPHLEIITAVLVNRNTANNDYQIIKKSFWSFGKLLDISPIILIFLKTFNSEFSFIKVWFTNQSSKHKINIFLVINQGGTYKYDSLFSSAKRSNICKRLRIFVFCRKYEQKHWQKYKEKFKR